MRKLLDYQIIDHGIEHSQYFQGCGTAFTEYSDVATGIGSSPADALQDALDQLDAFDSSSMPEYETDVAGILKLTDDRVTPIIAESCKAEGHDKDADDAYCDKCVESELYYHVSIRVSFEGDDEADHDSGPNGCSSECRACTDEPERNKS